MTCLLNVYFKHKYVSGPDLVCMGLCVVYVKKEDKHNIMST